MRSDEQIKKDVTEQLYWDNRIDASDVSVEVDSGIVELQGKLKSLSQLEAIRQNVTVIPGVTNIDDEQLTVVAMGQEDKDPVIEENARNVLDYSRDIDAGEIGVTVSKGWISLTGTVDKMWKKIKAESMVRELTGVLGVTNKITIVPTERADDEQIAEQIISSLERNKYVNVDNIDVVVKQGIVTLKGYVDDLSTSMSAQNTATYINGVVDVKNNLKIRDVDLSDNK